MGVTRRTFLKGSAVVGGAAVASKFLFGELETLVAGGPLALADVVEDVVPSACWIGKQDCGMLARRINGRIIKFEGQLNNPKNQGSLCPKGQAQIMAIYDPNRIKAPLIRTNEKGVPGKWKQTSWDEALSLVASKVNEVRAKDKSLVLWQKGRSKTEPLYDNAFVKALGASKLGHGAYCSDAGYRAAEYTVGPHGVLHPDFRHTRYLLAWGWNATSGGGNKFCWITWPQQMLPAKDRGLKIVAIDPRLRGMGPFADEWLPIRPGTDLALALALCNALIAQGTFDKEYLTKHTNSPFLVKDDGTFLRADDKELVWDEASSSTKPLDAQGVKPALEGEYTVQGVKVKTAFQLFKEHVAKSTPEWAADITGLSPEDIRRVAKELGANAMIGSKIVVDGAELPYRPVGIMAYHMAQQELGFQALRAMIMVMMLVGAVEAVGGQRIDSSWKVHANFDAIEKTKVKDPPYNFVLKDSKYFPINSGNPSMVAKVMMDPQKYGVEKTPEVMIIHMTNAAVAFADQKAIWDAYKKYKFIAAIDPWMSYTVDYFADVVLPAATVEKYEGPISASDTYTDAAALRTPPMKPLFQSRGEIDIYLDLCEKLGTLYGKDGFLDQINKEISIKDAYKLELDKKPTVREIFDRWARSEGYEEGVAYFEKNGVKVKGPVPATKYYGYAQKPPFGGLRQRLYGEGLLRIQKEMRAKGADQIYWQDYTPFPTWRTPTMDKSPKDYDLYLVSYKMIEFKQSRASHVPLLAELAREQRLWINPQTAQQKSLREEDEVWVESHNAITNENRRIRVKVAFTKAIRPDVVGLPHHYGQIIRHPWAEGQGPSPNALFFSGEGYVGATQDQSFGVKVKVYKA